MWIITVVTRRIWIENYIYPCAGRHETRVRKIRLKASHIRISGQHVSSLIRGHRVGSCSSVRQLWCEERRTAGTPEARWDRTTDLIDETYWQTDMADSRFRQDNRMQPTYPEYPRTGAFEISLRWTRNTSASNQRHTSECEKTLEESPKTVFQRRETETNEHCRVNGFQDFFHFRSSATQYSATRRDYIAEWNEYILKPAIINKLCSTKHINNSFLITNTVLDCHWKVTGGKYKPHIETAYLMGKNSER